MPGLCTGCSPRVCASHGRCMRRTPCSRIPAGSMAGTCDPSCASAGSAGTRASPRRVSKERALRMTPLLLPWPVCRQRKPGGSRVHAVCIVVRWGGVVTRGAAAFPSCPLRIGLAVLQAVRVTDLVEAAIKAGWVVVLSSDHGQVRAGGTGYYGGSGGYEGSEALRKVPFWVFRYMSNMNDCKACGIVRDFVLSHVRLAHVPVTAHGAGCLGDVPQLQPQ